MQNNLKTLTMSSAGIHDDPPFGHSLLGFRTSALGTRTSSFGKPRPRGSRHEPTDMERVAHTLQKELNDVTSERDEYKEKYYAIQYYEPLYDKETEVLEARKKNCEAETKQLEERKQQLMSENMWLVDENMWLTKALQHLKIKTKRTESEYLAAARDGRHALEICKLRLDVFGITE